MEPFIAAVDLALQSRNWYAALTSALILPDVAGWVDDPSQSSAHRYQRWFDNFVGPAYTSIRQNGELTVFLSGGDCYALRCSVLHEGRDETEHQRARDVLTRFQFVAPRGRNWIVHCNMVDSKLQLQLDIFCRDVCSGACTWLSQIPRNDFPRQRRLAELLRIQIAGPISF